MFNIIFQILSASSAGINTEKLFPYVVKLLASIDLTTKKLASWFISQHGDKEDLALLAINTVVKDCHDANPMVRGLALRTIISVRLPLVADHCLPAVIAGLDDVSAYVRRVAVLSCAKIHHLFPHAILEHSLVDKLYTMIRDPDPIVVTNTLHALNEILKTEGGVVVNHAIVRYLLARMSSFTDSSLPMIVATVKKYEPHGSDEVLDIMNVVDPCLKSGNASLLLQTIECFRYVIRRDLPHLENKVIRRASGQLLHFITVDDPETSFILLEYVDSLLLAGHASIFQPHYRVFFCRYTEPAYVKRKKISMLPALTSETSLSEVIEELGMYSVDVLEPVAAEAIVAVGRIARIFPSRAAETAEMFISLLDTRVSSIATDVLTVMQDLNLRMLPNLAAVLAAVERYAVTDVESEESQSAVICLLGEYGEHIDAAPYILERFIEMVREEPSSRIQASLLAASTKLFVKRPPECQELLGRVLEMCVNSDDVELQDRAIVYYQLLKTDARKMENLFAFGTAESIVK